MISQLHLGDWRDAIASWPARCALIVDPPYGIAWRRTESHSWRGQERFAKRPVAARRIKGDGDTSERDAAIGAIDWVVAAVFGHRRFDLIAPWSGQHVRDGGDGPVVRAREVLIFDKGEGVGAGDTRFPWKPCWESIAIYGKGWRGRRTSAVLRGSKIAYMAENADNGRLHPNEKPLEVMLELVAKTPARLPIVDPFMGSGTTGVAAALLGRDFYGAEIESIWFDKAEQRLDATPRGLFAAGGRVQLEIVPSSA